MCSPIIYTCFQDLIISCFKFRLTLKLCAYSFLRYRLCKAQIQGIRTLMTTRRRSPRHSGQRFLLTCQRTGPRRPVPYSPTSFGLTDEAVAGLQQTLPDPRLSLVTGGVHRISSHDMRELATTASGRGHAGRSQLCPHVHTGQMTPMSSMC